MDKRSFILLVLFTTTIFFVHRFFDKEPQAKKAVTQTALTVSPEESIPNATQKIFAEEKFYVLE
ncbi:MAG: hypothetical protein FJZ63_04645, partial [Chlamydiae bacterium]|nr:hypothetical protein [Chlamydiota bacterium]